MKTFFSLFLPLVFLLGVSVPGASFASDSKPVVLTVVSFKPKSQMEAGNLEMLMNRVKEKSKGELIIEFKGGPEAINPFGQPGAVKKGVVDMCWVPASFYPSLVPWAEAVVASQVTAWEERENGAYDFINNGHKKVGLFYLGRTTPSEGTGDFCIVTKKKTEKFEDLAGQKIGALGPIIIPIAKSLGATPLVINIMDTYTSLEQGIIDACFSTLQTHADLHLWEVVPYAIDHNFFCSPSVTLMNLDRWNKLPAHLQKILMESQKEVEHEYAPINTKLLAESAKKLKEGGVEFIKFSPADAEKYLKTINEAFWAYMIEKSPECAPLKKMLSK